MADRARGRGRGENAPVWSRGGNRGGGGFQDRGGRGGGFQDRGGRGGGFQDRGGRGGGFQDRGGRGGDFQDRGGRGGGFQDRGGRGGGFQERGGRGGGFQDRGGRGGGFEDRGRRGSGFHDRGGRGAGFHERGGRRGGFQDRGGRGGSRGSGFQDRGGGGAWQSSFSTPSPSESLGSLSVAGDDTPDQQIVTTSPGDTVGLEIAAEPSASAPVVLEEASLPTAKGKKTKARGSKKPPTLPVTFKEDRMLPSRPGGGTIGRKIVVEVNCWDFDVSDVSVLMYDITLTKLLSTDGKEIKLKEKGIGKYVRLIAERKRGDVFHDGGRILFSLGPLDGKDGEMLNFSEKIADPLQNDDLTIEYAAKRVGSISARKIRQYLDNSRSKTSDPPQLAINMLDNLIKWVNRASLPYLSKSAIFYDRPERDNTGGLFWIYRGYSLSFRPQWKCRLNIDMAHRAFFPAGNLADILYAKYGDNMYSPSTWKHVKEDILSLHVEASHYKNEASGKTYRKRFVVHGLSHNSADKEMIADINKSIAKYFKERYGIDLKYPELPCVKTKKDRDEYMPMELLEVLPFQNAKEDPGVIASAIIRCAAVRPADRFGNLREFVRSMNWRASLISKLRLGLRDMNPIKVEARELPQPSAHFSTGTVELGRGSWNQEPFHQPVPRSLRCVVVTMVPGYARNAPLVVERLPQAAQRFGVRMEVRGDILRKTVADLPQLFTDFRAKGVDLAIFVLTGTREYPFIKRQGDLHNFMFTQCIKDGTIGKPNVFNNLMLKINAKLGGVNWLVNGLSGRWNDELLMVVGADVTHPTGGGRVLNKSVAAVIASISRDLMRYVAIVRQQDKIREGKTIREYIDGMEDIFSDLLKIFAKHNNDRLPAKVIFYRDGVSEGQFDPVLRIELSAMQRACSNLRPDYEPGITFIVVQKRHHIRFNPVGSRGKNVLPGTVVDTQITHHREFDFYLCSQDGIQGTSKPAHYHVLYDDNDWQSDDLQQFTYYLCHAYMRCCRSVSYPAPTYYSHLAAFRARDWLKFVENETIIRDNRFTIHPGQQDQMFFL
ncbi:Protein argonaute-3 [Echinococcus granulosus]|nr:Protein argonaute-3 [Echinococcus granulosus]